MRLHSFVFWGALSLLSPTVFAQVAQVNVDTLSGITDLSQNPNFHNAADDQVSTGSNTLSPITAQTFDSFGTGFSEAVATGQAGILRARSKAGYGYFVPSLTDGGYASVNATVEVNDWLTPTSTIYANGTAVTLHFVFAVHGSVDVPDSDQQRPGITAIGLTHVDATTSIDSFAKTITVPSQNLDGSITFDLNAQIGSAFKFRYSLEAATYLSSSIPDYRVVSSNFYSTGIMSIAANDPNVSFTTASGYNYAPVPEPTSLCALGLGVATFARRKRKNA